MHKWGHFVTLDRIARMWYAIVMAKKKPRPKQRQFDVGVIYGDIHDPYCDEPVFEMFLEALGIIRPNFIIENGDGFDFYQCSPFLRDPARINDLAKDRDTFVRRRETIMQAVGKGCRKRYLPGNHELWLRRYLWAHAPELSSLPELEWYEFLGLRELGWDYIDFEGVQNPMIDVGNLTVTHGTFARKPLGASLRAMLDDLGCSVLFNHTHRMGWLPTTNMNSEHAAWENGCLCLRQVGNAYVKGSVRWQQGFSIVTVEPLTKWFRVHPMQILRVPGTPKKRLMLHEKVLECSI